MYRNCGGKKKKKKKRKKKEEHYLCQLGKEEGYLRSRTVMPETNKFGKEGEGKCFTLKFIWKKGGEGGRGEKIPY